MNRKIGEGPFYPCLRVFVNVFGTNRQKELGNNMMIFSKVLSLTFNSLALSSLTVLLWISWYIFIALIFLRAIFVVLSMSSNEVTILAVRPDILGHSQRSTALIMPRCRFRTRPFSALADTWMPSFSHLISLTKVLFHLLPYHVTTYVSTSQNYPAVGPQTPNL